MRRFAAVFGVVVLGLASAGCPHAGGSYVQGDRQGGDVDRGETNGTMFDFVSNKPDGDDWQIRIRGSSMWASYGHEDSTDDLGTVNLDDKETKKIWKLINAVDIQSRKTGKKDADAGFVELRLREPGVDKHDIYTTYLSRETEDDQVLALATYLQKLVAKYHTEKPNF